MKILIACEESQAVTIELRNLGIEAYSCDLIECSGGYPEWHIVGDALKEAYSGKYDAMIAFPPCTHLAVSGARHFKQKIKDGRQQKSIDFFMELFNAPINFIAIENPIGIMSSKLSKPDQIIHPYYFGDNVPKSTCLWLKNLPKLQYSKSKTLFEEKTTVEPEYFMYASKKTKSGYSKYSYLGTKSSTNNPAIAKLRSKTYLGIALAMATQWGKYILDNPVRIINQ